MATSKQKAGPEGAAYGGRPPTGRCGTHPSGHPGRPRVGSGPLAAELGITDALACFTKGDVGGCINTAINVVSTVVGGALGKLAVRYGSPLKWGKLAKLTSRVKGLLTDLLSSVKTILRKGCHSFAPGTLVLMANGKKKPIEKIKPGEKVIATDPVTNKTKSQSVVATHINLDKDFTDLVINTAGKRPGNPGASGASGGMCHDLLAGSKRPY